MKLIAASETWPLAKPFTISRGSRTATNVVTVTLEDGSHRGRGECTPYPRYNESTESALNELNAAALEFQRGEPVASLLGRMRHGAARNALDCAWWDLRCKQAGKRITGLIGQPAMKPILTAYTLSLDSPRAMELAARANADRPLLKIKAGAKQAVECVEAVRQGAPNSELIVDANEAWDARQLPALLKAMAALRVAFVEQPLPQGKDDALAKMVRPVPVFADESFHVAADLDLLGRKYDGINIKLDKTGGFTEALHALAAGRERQLKVMVGCMLGTSLAMAPAMLIAQGADYIDLDAPLLLKEDRAHGISFNGSIMHPFSADLWG
jgi:L-alanine-DL-glutamate epimerase-like enolase superfamily enzyme